MWLAVKARPLWGVWLETAAAQCPCRSRAWWRRGRPGLAQFFRFPFYKKIIDLPGGQINDLIWETLFSVVSPCNSLIAWRANQWPLNSLVSVSDPWRAFWADTAPFKGLALCIASGTTEIQGHHQVCRARRRTTDKNLDWCAFVANALFYTNPWLWKVNRIELS